jgi:hypothetical protein
MKHRDRARIFSQEDLLTVMEKTVTDREIMVTRFNPNNPDIMKIIKDIGISFNLVMIAMTISTITQC